MCEREKEILKKYPIDFYIFVLECAGAQRERPDGGHQF